MYRLDVLFIEELRGAQYLHLDETDALNGAAAVP